MDLRTRLIAPLFRSLGGDKKIFDLDAFIKRILLFETYIVNSERLTEIPHLVRIFSFDGIHFNIIAGYGFILKRPK